MESSNPTDRSGSNEPIATTQYFGHIQLMAEEYFHIALVENAILLCMKTSQSIHFEYEGIYMYVAKPDQNITASIVVIPKKR